MGAFGMRSERRPGRPSSARHVFHASRARPRCKANTTGRWLGRCSKWPGHWDWVHKRLFQDGGGVAVQIVICAICGCICSAKAFQVHNCAGNHIIWYSWLLKQCRWIKLWKVFFCSLMPSLYVFSVRVIKRSNSVCSGTPPSRSAVASWVVGKDVKRLLINR